MTLVLLVVMIAGQTYFYEDPVEEEEDTGGLVRVYDSRTKMGTVVSIIVYAESEEDGLRAINKAFSMFDSVEHRATRYNESSELMQLNLNGTMPYASPHLEEMFEAAIEFGNLTDGAFDVTVLPLIDLWSYDPEAPVQFWDLNESEQMTAINDTMPYIGWDKIEIIDHSTTTRNVTIQYESKKMSCTLDGIAKGYAVDRALWSLAQLHGIEHALVNAGGDIGTIGTKANGDLWTIAMENPENVSEFIINVEVDGMAVATSGNYRRFYDPNESVGHILDPSTGYSATESMSVMIIAEDATTADALATGVFVMGPTDGMALIDTLDDVEALIIGDDSTIYTSEGLTDYGELGVDE